MADRAQSQTLGFAAVFALVLLLVLTVGGAIYPAVQDERARQNVEGTERGFDLLADNVDDVVDDDATSRTTTLRLAGGSLSFGDPVTVSVTVDGEETTSVSSRPLVYRSGEGTRLVYVGGAVLREEDHGTVMVSGPRQFAAGGRTVLPLVRLHRASGPEGIDSSATVTVRTTRNGSRLALAEPAADNVTVAVTSPRAAAWNRTLDAEGFDCSLSGDTTTCERTTGRAYVTVVDVDVRLG